MQGGPSAARPDSLHDGSVTEPHLRTCIKCGREVVGDMAMCSICNRAGMATPSTTQYHGTIVVAIVLAVVGLAFAASLSLRGVGPYAPEVVAFRPDADGLAVTLAVRNEGSRAGRAQCQLTAVAANGSRLRAVAVLSPRIDGGKTATFQDRIPAMGGTAANVTVSCR